MASANKQTVPSVIAVDVRYFDDVTFKSNFFLYLTLFSDFFVLIQRSKNQGYPKIC
jgi:hypothetical protein